MARRRAAAAALALLAAAALALPPACRAAAPPSKPSPSTGPEAAAVFTYLSPSKAQPLSDVPGCGGQTVDPVMDTCRIEDNIKIHDVHEYQFVVPVADRPENEFSLLLTAKSFGGLTEM
jgi:hypothetical protein